VRPDLETDFRNQQVLLLSLIADRLDVADETLAAQEIERQITKTKALVRSYQTVKWFEGEP